MEKIQVFFIDRQVLLRQGVCARLLKEDDVEVIGEAEEEGEAFSQIKMLSPDVVILGLRRSAVNGLDLVHKIRQHLPRVPVIILAADEDDEQLFLAIKAGAAAYFTTDVSSEELINAIRRSYRGEYLINEGLLTRPKLASRVIEQFQALSSLGEEIGPLLSPLSRRETEILNNIAQGNSNKQIAYALGVSNQTVKNHVTSILRKLAANDRTHAVVLALRRGYIKI